MSSCASRRCAAPKMRSESRLAIVSDSRDLSSAIDLALAVASAAANWRLASRRSRFCAAASSLRSYCAWSSACRWGIRRGNSRRRQLARAPYFGGQKTRVDLRCEVNARGSMARAWERWWGATVGAGRGGARTLRASFLSATWSTRSMKAFALIALALSLDSRRASASCEGRVGWGDPVNTFTARRKRPGENPTIRCEISP